eukprot:scaffold154393_cov54-Attheya_sp.AAC.4
MELEVYGTSRCIRWRTFLNWLMILPWCWQTMHPQAQDMKSNGCVRWGKWFELIRTWARVDSCGEMSPFPIRFASSNTSMRFLFFSEPIDVCSNSNSLTRACAIDSGSGGSSHVVEFFVGCTWQQSHGKRSGNCAPVANLCLSNHPHENGHGGVGFRLLKPPSQ